VTFAALTCVHAILAVNFTNSVEKPIVKATWFDDMPGKYYLSHKIFSFCAPELSISASGTVISSLTFSGGSSSSACGSGPWDTKTYPAGSGGWASTMGTRVQSKNALSCGGDTVVLMITRAENDYTTEKPLWGTEDKYFNYKDGIKYVSFVRNDVGACIYADRQLCSNGDTNYPGCRTGLSTVIKAVIGAGAAVILLLCICLVFYCLRWKKNINEKKKKTAAENQPPPETFYDDNFY